MFTEILRKPLTITQHVVGGVVRVGLNGAVAVVRKVLPDQGARTRDASPEVSTEPLRQPPSPTTTTKKAKATTAPAKKASAKKTAKKTPAKKTAKKPASTLNEDPAPDDADPIVYSTGPDGTTDLPEDDQRP